MASGLLTTGLNYSASQKNPQILPMAKNQNTPKNKTVNFRVGPLEVLIASTPEQIRAAQRLRYRVFYLEMGAKASKETHKARRDFDEYDVICDHILVIDHDANKKVVGAYRVLRRSQLLPGMKFYTQNEYDITKALRYFKGEVMELGRSCVDRAYRTRNTMQLLWRAIGEYTALYNVELLFGCASFPGYRYKMHATHLAYLYHYHLAPVEWRPRVKKNRRAKPMNVIDKYHLDKRECLTTLPPLIKGYLRVGGFVGNGAYKDKQYNTTDVCIIVKTDQITDKYATRYGTGNGTKEKE